MSEEILYGVRDGEPYRGNIDGYEYAVVPGYYYPEVVLSIPNINQRYAIWREFIHMEFHGSFGVNTTASTDFLCALDFFGVPEKDYVFKIISTPDYVGCLFWAYNVDRQAFDGYSDYIKDKIPDGKKWTLAEIVEDVRKVVEQIKKFECCQNCGECRGFNELQMEMFNDNEHLYEMAKSGFFNVNECTKFPNGILGKTVYDPDKLKKAQSFYREEQEVE